MSFIAFGCTSMPLPPSDVELCEIDMPLQTCHIFKKDASGTWATTGDRDITTWDKGFIIKPEHLLEVKSYIHQVNLWIEQNVK